MRDGIQLQEHLTGHRVKEGDVGKAAEASRRLPQRMRPLGTVLDGEEEENSFTAKCFHIS